MLEAKGINGFYSELQVLYDISLKVDTGELVVIFGANGYGADASKAVKLANSLLNL